MSTVDRFKIQDAYNYALFAADYSVDGDTSAFDGEKMSRSAALRRANKRLGESGLDIAVRFTSIKWAGTLAKMIKTEAEKHGIDAYTGELLSASVSGVARPVGDKPLAQTMVESWLGEDCPEEVTELAQNGLWRDAALRLAEVFDGHAAELRAASREIV